MKHSHGFAEYQKQALETVGYEPLEGAPVVYPALGLAGEVGEVVEKTKKIYRDNNGTIDHSVRYGLVMELGDVLWFVSALDFEFSGAGMQILADFDASDPLPLPLGLENSPAAIALRMSQSAGNVAAAILGVVSSRGEQVQSIAPDLRAIIQCVVLYADIIDVPVADIMKANIQKLKYRVRTGKIGGSGDNR
ncbi:nucleoside triphosphate pyrophosphohydrolase family protein (plasmid) [Trichlorobacter lovleyi]|uniref:nucleoside triphosphate pyrophosphohydrolase family protein n=1 Tax=Trichlorobacter lovleyi TaxID=313985 RepID=UPI00223EEA16|nr:nucleoside triphosphate pyrophosphohydrolase family protein [Trichlorobacter lovleyi]QOX80823.1 nucleoside triphosphate pyrophosphohydrolase family protein [Trichlorobacter lovleyi]